MRCSLHWMLSAVIGCCTITFVDSNSKDLLAQSQTTSQAKSSRTWNVGKIVKEPANTPVWTDANSAAKEFEGFGSIGEYTDSENGMQVVAAEGRFYVSVYRGGLPGAGWNGNDIEHEWVESDSIAALVEGWNQVDRSSELIFETPPKDATVLFDGTKGGHWRSGQVRDRMLVAGARTKKAFRDFRLHVEFMTPLKPTLPLSHPGRGNSGVFALGAYEVQVMDTFGLDPDPLAWQSTPILKKPDTWCGSIYGIQPPAINVCLPPLTWQTLDIEFIAARFDGEQKKRDARITVHQNGILIQDRVKISSGTGGGPSGPRPEVPKGPIYIQKHGSPVMYRNIWIVELNTNE